MGTIRWIAAYMILFCSFALKAQSQVTGAQPESSAKDQANVNDQQPADSAQAASAIESDSNGNMANVNDANGSNAGQVSEEPSNVPAVPQTTSSQSGSPAVLADEGGNGRDGTNNVQRATMNMAGAPAANLKLDDRSEEVDAEMKDRQNYSRDKRTSAKRSGDRSGSPDAINANSRRENNAQSGQNLSSKDRKNAGGSGGNQTPKSKRGDKKKRG